MRVDMHAHVIPDSFPEAAGAADTERWPAMRAADSHDARLLVAGKLRFTARDVFFDAERRMSAMDASGVDAEVVSPFPPLLNYDMTPQGGRELCRVVNDFIARLCATDPARFLGLGTVPLQDPDLAAEEMARVQELGLYGIEIGSNVGGSSLGDERFLSFFQEAQRLRIPIFVHATAPTVTDRLPGPAMASFGVGTEIGLTVASIIMGGTADKCPDLRLAFSHGGGGFSLMLSRAHYFWAGTWNEEPPPADGSDGPPRSEPSPGDYARRFYYDALVFDRRALRYLIDLIGSDRLLLGTDFPAMPREQPVDRTLRSMDLDPDVHADITGNNCLRFLGVDPSAARR